MKIVLFIKSATILYTKMYVYVCLWSEQWAVGIMGCRNNGPSELWAVGIMTRNRFWVGPQIPCGGPQLSSAVFTPPCVSRDFEEVVIDSDTGSYC